MTTFLLYILLLNPVPESNLNRFMDCWLCIEPEPCVYTWDENGDGIVNFVDYAEMLK